MADDEKKTATIKLYRDNVPRITITYKNKKDLFKQFQKKINQMNLSDNEIYWADWDNDRSVVKTADDLFAAVENNSVVKMFVRTEANNRENDVISCPSSDEEEEEKPEKEPEKKEEMRNRSPSPARGRGRSRSEPRRHRSRSHTEPSYDQMPWNFAPWMFAMDPRYGYGPMPFYCDPRGHGKGRRGRHERRDHKCCCNDVCKDSANL
ncbi:hypothetical protein Aduo_001063 [Ancylostoma duodenale]